MRTKSSIRPPRRTRSNSPFDVPRGPTRNIRFVDPRGSAVAGVTVRGLVSSPMSVILEGSEAEVLALSLISRAISSRPATTENTWLEQRLARPIRR